jgi:23S rRNA G2445 N2-methylase RlmL
MIFPTIIYKCPGKHHCKGGTYDYIQVKTKEDFEAKLKDGYFETLPEAMGEEPAIDKVSPPTREELEAKAKELDIGFNNRTTDKSLSKKIEDKLKDK